MNCPSTSSGLQSATALISSNIGRLHAIQVITDGTNAATLVVYDNNAASATGTVLAKIKVSGAGLYETLVMQDAGQVVNKGLYCVLTGTGAEYIVHYGV